MKIEYKAPRGSKRFTKKGLEVIKKQATEELEKRLDDMVC